MKVVLVLLLVLFGNLFRYGRHDEIVNGYSVTLGQAVLNGTDLGKLALVDFKGEGLELILFLSRWGRRYGRLYCRASFVDHLLHGRAGQRCRGGWGRREAQLWFLRRHLLSDTFYTLFYF